MYANVVYLMGEHDDCEGRVNQMVNIITFNSRSGDIDIRFESHSDMMEVLEAFAERYAEIKEADARKAARKE